MAAAIPPLSTLSGAKTATNTAARITANAIAQQTRLITGIKFTVPTGNLYWGGSDATATAASKQIQSGDEIDPSAVTTIGDIYLVSDTTATYSFEIVGQVVDLV